MAYYDLRNANEVARIHKYLLYEIGMCVEISKREGFLLIVTLLGMER